MTARALLPLALLAAACATVEGPPPGPSPFRAVKQLVLVRRVDEPRPPRPRDPLDALKESLDARGYETRIVEVGRGSAAELRDLERLEDEVAARLASRDYREGRVERLGPAAGERVAKLGVDAIVGYHRLDDRSPLLVPQRPQPWGAPFPQPQPRAVVPRPVSALSLVGRDGAAAWFPWGGQGAELDAGALLNAAEAIDALLAALAGEAGEAGEAAGDAE